MGLMEELRKSLKWAPPYEIELRIREEAVRVAKDEGLQEGEEKGEIRGKGRRTKGKARIIGAKNKAVEVARAALAKGLDVGMVAEISGLSEREIRAL